MAVDIIARGMAANASGGGGGDVVETNPIVQLDNGQYKLVEKGKIVNTDTVEYQQRQQAQAAQQQQSQSANPSTGGVVVLSLISVIIAYIAQIQRIIKRR